MIELVQKNGCRFFRVGIQHQTYLTTVLLKITRADKLRDRTNQIWELALSGHEHWT